MNKRQLAKLEKMVPQLAVTALDAASKRAAESALPQVLVIDNGLYRISSSVEKELIRMLAPRTQLPGRAKKSKS